MKNCPAESCLYPFIIDRWGCRGHFKIEVSDGIFEHDPPLSTHRPLGPFRRVGAFLDEILCEDGRAQYISVN